MKPSLMFDGVLSDGEREKLRKSKEDQIEMQNLAKMRLDARSDSMEQAGKLLREARARNEAARHAYEEALVRLAPDDDDDYPTELEKIEKFELIEHEYIKAGRLYLAAVVRVAWELRDADQQGIK
jgi:hypothetical protein